MGKQKRKSEDASPPLPTAAELEILNLLWESGEMTVREVHEKLSPAKSTGYTTALNQMRVMHEKGLLIRNERYRSHVYSARLTREATQQQLADDLMSRAFGGSTKSFVLGALSTNRASREEVQQLRRLLAEYEKGMEDR
jgi:BlaI family transcriptional regulator, penicillinase repressor